jgi:ABC-2 type transport system permease protein
MRGSCAGSFGLRRSSAPSCCSPAGSALRCRSRCAAFAALGVALAVLARDVETATLLAFALALPLAFLALVPQNAVSAGLYDVIRVISAAFPFKPALDGLQRGLDGEPLAGPALHLVALTAVYGAAARLGLRRLRT